MAFKIIQKVLKNLAREGQKSKKIEVWRGLYGLLIFFGFEAAFWRHLGLILAASWRHLEAILGSKIEEESIKIDVENETFFGIDFSSIF